MKKIFLLSVLLAVSVVSNSHGKSSHYRKGRDLEKVKFGVRGGWNIAGWETNKASRRSIAPRDVSMDLKSGGRWDLYGEYGLTDAFGVQLALIYAPKGSKYTLNHVEFRDDYTLERAFSFDFDYISLSPSLRMYPGKDRQFCIFLGCSFAVLVRAKLQALEDDEAIGDSIDLLSEEIPEEGRPKRFDVGIIYGLDYEFDNGILLGYCVDWGLTNVWPKRKNVKKSQQPKAENRTVQLWIGYNFAKLFH